MSPLSTMCGTVVLVEDDPTVREVLALLLRSTGWHVQEAADGYGALALVEADRPDVVVTDLRMPGMSGLELGNRLGSAPDTADLPVVAITSDTGELRDAAVGSEHFATVLSKPVTPVEFLEAVHRVVQASHGG